MKTRIYAAPAVKGLINSHSARTVFYTEHCAACSNQTQTARMYQNADSSLRKHKDLTQCCFNIGPGPLVGGGGGQYWNSIESNSRVCWAPHRCLSTPTPPLHNIFDTFNKTARQSQAYYNTWNWEWGTYDVTHLQILTCEVAVSTAGSVTVFIRLNLTSVNVRFRRI